MERNYPWLSEESIGEFLNLFSNFLSLGQYEQGRAVLMILFKKHPQTVETILRTIITQGPPQHWLTSASVPTVGHLIWNLWCDYHECFPEVLIQCPFKDVADDVNIYF